MESRHLWLLSLLVHLPPLDRVSFLLATPSTPQNIADGRAAVGMQSSAGRLMVWIPAVDPHRQPSPSTQAPPA